MINADMKTYNYFTFGESKEYGQAELSKTAQGTIKIALYNTNTNIQDNINYKDCNYLGLTMDNVNDTYVIEMNETEKLKIQYVQPKGRFKQVYLKQI